MKLVIQIPCYNEEESLPATVAALPREVPGFDSVEFLVIDDGSTDRTSAVAGELGLSLVVRHTKNRGLAAAFMTGLRVALDMGADVIVNTDADNQYAAAGIADLVAPILQERAELVVGARPIDTIAHFSRPKKVLQRMGSWVVRVVSHTSVADAPCGFRAFSRKAAQRFFLFGDYSHTLETIIQAGIKNMSVASVPVRVNPRLRPSRLIRNVPEYVIRSTATIVRIFVIYRPMLLFGTLGTVLFSAGLLLGLRFIYFYAAGDGRGHVQSLILASVLLGIGFQTLLAAFIADLLAANRKLLEEIRMREFEELRPPDRVGAGGSSHA